MNIAPTSPEGVPEDEAKLPPVCTIERNDPLEHLMAEALAAVLLAGDGSGA